MSRDLVFEIGTEEIPAKFMNKTLEQLKEVSEKSFTENRINFKSLETYGTPRRLVLYVKALDEKQEDLETELKGPSKKAAYDAESNPTKALLGFAKGNGLSLENVYIKELSGTEYVYGRKHVSGIAAKEVLKELLPEILTSISFPKSMKWGNKSFRFARPVRWLMPIYGDELIEFDKDGIPCSKFTRGHRVLSKDKVEIDRAENYFDILKREYVIVDQNERREIIQKQCEKIAKEKNGVLIKDEELLEEIVYLVEYPTALLGSFESDFLKLPKEAIITPMKEHQRYFPIENEKGELLNNFIAVRNGDDSFIDVVRQGNEKVLRARLSDARFFYEEDKKVSLDDCVEKLKHVVFQETLGTIYDKTRNIMNNSAYLADCLNLDRDSKNKLDRAAYLAKADLVTSMVKEFDELQGIMGREYALVQGEDAKVANAIEEHYMPRNAGDAMPASIIGSVLSIADRIDTISGCFSIGIQPTGSQDPYALRRQAISIINIILDQELHINLKSLIENAIKPFYNKGIIKAEVSNVIDDINEFFKQRLRNVLLDRRYDYDVIDAVLKTGLIDIQDALLRIKELSDWKSQQDFLSIAGSFNRVSNLAAKADSLEINGELLAEKAEKELYESYTEVSKLFRDAVEKRDYYNALKSLMLLKAPIDNFFDNTMVMVDDKCIRRNRLALLKNIESMMMRFADLSVIVVSR
ncbi:glycine--tRNA ligase subunit beta [Lutispora saccharofermentans]|uniref:Glycine--tRNA ligase beta subunit n=1 Tax=Lutispora saccharofermentans TaxID=3024236 RepID=A0ABT1NHW7_9FIRM|nr:glycine--tRNA ligase subunit beta [Lutispora saccharofermentans]MCQ1530845.1 glycine--tRNA ligase subunit beta [Lutispora saccharofermentans]